MATAPELQVVRLPCDGSPMELKKIPLVDIGTGDIEKDDCNDLEKRLEHIPNLKSFASSKHFSWFYRTLVGTVNNDVGEDSWKADYMMYMCLDKRSDLPHNDELERLVKIGRGPAHPMVPFDVYGDAFVFRMESKSELDNEPKRAKYVDMDSHFIEGVKAEKIEYGTWAFCTLRKLLVCP